MTFSPKINSIKEQRSFKRRGLKNKKEYSLKFGNVGLFFAQEGVMKSSYFRRMTRIVKKRLKRKPVRSRGIKKRVWFFANLNFPLTLKSTNSRMGKGKGSFHSWAIRVRSGQPLAEFKNFSFFFIKGLRFFFFKKTKVRLSVVFSNKIKNNFYISNLVVFTWKI